jgi:hypothetical protein
MHKIMLCVAGLAAFAGVSSAQADDSSAALGAGGLVLTQSSDIRMAKEDLYVSPKAVRVHFEFTNDSTKDISTIVAFPLPDIDNYKFWGEAVGTTTDDPVNFVGFEVKEDGRTIPIQVEQRAFYNGRDVTEAVKAAGAPVNAIVAQGWKSMAKVSKGGIAALIRAGLVEHEDGGNGGDNIAKWTTRTKFFWQQRFPAGKTVVLDERYQPVTGQSFFSDSELDGANAEETSYWQKGFCIDAPTRSAIAAKISESKKASPQNGGLLNAFSTDYILVTGNNWKGPIGDFHLTVDKQRADSILSMCWDGDLKKTGATTFEASRENFAPRHDIKLLVLTGSPPPG